MNNTLLKLYVKGQILLDGEEGQDLMEYALLISLITLASIAAMNGMATAIVSAFANISTSIA